MKLTIKYYIHNYNKIFSHYNASYIYTKKYNIYIYIFINDKSIYIFMYIQLVCISINTYALNLLNIQQSSFVAGIAYLQLKCSLQL